jgi:RNA polymerase sigma-70 factor (ECF subfamily)
MTMTVDRGGVVVRDTGEDEDDWVARLRSGGAVGEEALRRLHALMLRAARHQVGRMAGGRELGAVRGEEIVHAAADEATMAVMSRLATFEGRSRFTTWAYKFAIFQAAVEVRRAAWRPAEVELTPAADRAADTWTPERVVEASDFGEAVRDALDTQLTPHQRRIALALIIEGVPIDVLALQLGTNRNALYKTLHDARTRLRAVLTAEGYLGIPAEEALR